MILSREMAYLPDNWQYEEVSRVPRQVRTASISSTQAWEQYLSRGRPLPGWFVRPEVGEILAETHPPRQHQGVCIWLTGLSGAGKSTTAEVLTVLLMEHGKRVTVLDSDVVRGLLSKGLGFSKEDCDANIKRIGYVASEIVRHGGVAVCAAVSPYLVARNNVRNMMGDGRFIEVYVNTPLSVCEERDVLGMYSMARRGEIKGFTGIDDPYEAPKNPEIILDTVTFSAGANAHVILDYLMCEGFVKPVVGVGQLGVAASAIKGSAVIRQSASAAPGTGQPPGMYSPVEHSTNWGRAHFV